MLDAFEVPECMLPAFDAVVDNIKRTLCTLRANGKTESAQFWLMFTTTSYNHKLKRVEPKVRLISFRSTASMVDAATIDGDPYQKTLCELEYDLIRVSFNEDSFSAPMEGMQDDVLDRGEKLAKQFTVDIEHVEPNEESC